MPSQSKGGILRGWIFAHHSCSITSLREALNLSMSLHRAIIRQGTSIIDKQDIRTMRNHRVVVLTQGPDLALFSHPSVLARLALWLVDALRDRIPGRTRRSLPFVVACLDEVKGSYTVVGVMAALDFGEVCKKCVISSYQYPTFTVFYVSDFAITFLHARDRSNAKVKHTSFDTSVIEVQQNELTSFLEALTEG
jgi:cell division control protein 45